MISLTDLHAANKARQTEWCTGGDPEPDLAFRGNELAGETGEACNVIKKLERERHGWRGSRATLDDLAQELADVIICTDLCAITAGIDLAAAVVAKFNATSEKQGLATKLAAASQAAPVTGTEGEKARDRIASVRLIPWEPDSLGGALVTFDRGFKVAVPLYQMEGSNRLTITDPATAPQPAGAERVDLEKQIDAAAEAILSRRGFGYYTDPMEGGQDAYDISIEAREEAAAALKAASPLVPASLPAALGSGEGTAGATPAGSGSRPSDQAASHPAPAGFDPSRGWQPIATAPKDNEDSILVCDARVIGGFHQVVWWSEGPKAAGYNWYTSDGPNFHRDAFTHWMPLPGAPAALATLTASQEQAGEVRR